MSCKSLPYSSSSADIFVSSSGKEPESLFLFTSLFVVCKTLDSTLYLGGMAQQQRTVF